MNRSLANVILGGYEQKAVTKKEGDEEVKTHTEIDTASVAEALVNAKEVIIVPGYGLAVANAQYAIAELSKMLNDKGVRVRFGIHPVAGRMPGKGGSGG